ncbi:hypothetical protein, conserved [Eimeria tenella]|uniref:Uncharacterized protein n=1 Tax=Eimeria tenella TaxID=5802 RepID=U6L8E1_EIMTE|nr:hypothetical protein, conserved [Eimeria tenella]CDJ44055.1 hypothetical protein, conserved [Eimeria tenella]|eukprot:XP_013234804.1 hypothetical protein, conserved [Eimeria tenella]
MATEVSLHMSHPGGVSFQNIRKTEDDLHISPTSEVTTLACSRIYRLKPRYWACRSSILLPALASVAAIVLLVAVCSRAQTVALGTRFVHRRLSEDDITKAGLKLTCEHGLDEQAAGSPSSDQPRASHRNPQMEPSPAKRLRRDADAASQEGPHAARDGGHLSVQIRPMESADALPPSAEGPGSREKQASSEREAAEALLLLWRRTTSTAVAFGGTKSQATVAPRGSIPAPSFDDESAWLGSVLDAQNAEVAAPPVAYYVEVSTENEGISLHHPFCNLPRVSRAGLRSRANFEAAMENHTGGTSSMHLVHEAHALLSKVILSPMELDHLVRVTERLVANTVVYQSHPIPYKGPAKIVKQLGIRFLIFETVISTLMILEQKPEGNWWNRLISPVHDHSFNLPTAPKRRHETFNVSLIRDLVSALNTLKSGKLPDNQERVDLKRRLFCSPYSHPFFKSALFDVWRAEDQRFFEDFAG